jgi:hypothetical protein
MKADHPPMTKAGDFYGEQGCATCGRPLRIVSLWRLGKHFFAHEPAR